MNFRAGSLIFSCSEVSVFVIYLYVHGEKKLILFSFWRTNSNLLILRVCDGSAPLAVCLNIFSQRVLNTLLLEGKPIYINFNVMHTISRKEKNLIISISFCQGNPRARRPSA